MSCDDVPCATPTAWFWGAKRKTKYEEPLRKHDGLDRDVIDRPQRVVRFVDRSIRDYKMLTLSHSMPLHPKAAG